GLAAGLSVLLLALVAKRMWALGRRRITARSLGSEDGTVVAEFALVLPLVMILFGTLLQITLFANTAVLLRYAAFTAARSAIVSFQADTPLGITTDN
ncbi:unnamed protein product, partial [Scytosiphon promiscuus]